MNFSKHTLENCERTLAAELAGSTIVDSWPLRMVFEFTGACNLHCFMCGCEMAREKLRDHGVKRFTMDVSAFRLWADTAFPHIQIVNPTLSGEAFLLPYFDELIEKVAQYSCRLDITTNGMLMKGERLRKALPHMGQLTISFDGASKETFDYIRIGADFNVVMQNMKELQRLRHELGLVDKFGLSLHCTILRENVHELPQIVEIAAAHDIPLVSGVFLIVYEQALLGSSPLHEPQKVNEALAAARERGRELGVELRLPQALPLDAAKSIRVECDVAGDALEAAATPGPETLPAAERPRGAHGIDIPELEELDTAASPVADGLSASPEAPPPSAAEPSPLAAADVDVDKQLLTAEMPADWKGKYYCNFPWRTVFIDQQGDVAPCCQTGRPIVGNVNETPFLEIWNSPAYQALRGGFVTGELVDYCRNCTFLHEAGSSGSERGSYDKTIEV